MASFVWRWDHCVRTVRHLSSSPFLQLLEVPVPSISLVCGPDSGAYFSPQPLRYELMKSRKRTFVPLRNFLAHSFRANPNCCSNASSAKRKTMMIILVYVLLRFLCLKQSREPIIPLGIVHCSHIYKVTSKIISKPLDRPVDSREKSGVSSDKAQ